MKKKLKNYQEIEMKYDVNVELLNRVEEYNFSDVAKQEIGRAHV